MTNEAQEQEEGDLTTIQKEYEEAVKRNQKAKAHLESLLRQQRQNNDSHHQTPLQNNHSSSSHHIPNSRTRHQTTHLTTHLQNLRLQRQYNNLQTLAAYTKEIELIAKREHLYEDISLTPVLNTIIRGSNRSQSSIGDSDDPEDKHEHEYGHEVEIVDQQRRRVDSLLSTARELTSKLELAIVSARLGLKRERAGLLQVVQRQQTNNDDNVVHASAGADTLTNENSMSRNREGIRELRGSNDDDESTIKLRALQATRAELQRWIAETLRRCEEGEEDFMGQHDKARLEEGEEEHERRNHHKNEEANTSSDIRESDEGDLRLHGVMDMDMDMDMEIDAEYTRYIATRKRLLRVLDALKKPLPPATAAVALSSTKVEEQAEHKSSSTASGSTKTTTTPQLVRSTTSDSSGVINHNQRPQLHHHHHSHSHKSRISLSYTTKTADFITGPSLSEIKAQHIPTYQHAKVTSAYVADLKRQTHSLDARMLEMLTLLGHESHLLPAYPYPSLTHASGGVRSRMGGEEEGKKQNNKGQDNMDDELLLTREAAEIGRLLEAWKFAAAAADARLTEEIGRDVDEAERALRGAEEQLEGVRALEGTMRELMAADERTRGGR